MSKHLGISVGPGTIHAVVRQGERIRWAGTAAWSGLGDLTEVVARLAAEAGPRVTRTCIVLERGVVQQRVVEPAPPMNQSALRRYTRLQSSRLFRNGHGGLVTDARIARPGGRRVMVAVAVDESLVGALLSGCEQAGLSPVALGPASEILAHATAGVAATSSVAVPTMHGLQRLDIDQRRAWRASRLRLDDDVARPPWHTALAALGEEATGFAPAFAATRFTPALALFPEGARAKRQRGDLARLKRAVFAALLTWTVAGAVRWWRLTSADHGAAVELARLAPVAESALTLQRDLSAATEAIGRVQEAALHRSRYLALLAGLSLSLGDSVTLLTLRLERDSTLHLSGYAPVADGVVAALERTAGIQRPHFEAPASRQSISASGRPAREWDRFALRARLERFP